MDIASAHRRGRRSKQTFSFTGDHVIWLGIPTPINIIKAAPSEQPEALRSPAPSTLQPPAVIPRLTQRSVPPSIVNVV